MEGWVYTLESGDSNEYTQHTISWQNKSYRKNIVGTQNEFELAMVNAPSAFELLRFDCIRWLILIIIILSYHDSFFCLCNISFWQCAVKANITITTVHTKKKNNNNNVFYA